MVSKPICPERVFNSIVHDGTVFMGVSGVTIFIAGKPASRDSIFVSSVRRQLQRAGRFASVRVDRW